MNSKHLPKQTLCNGNSVKTKTDFVKHCTSTPLQKNKKPFFNCSFGSPDVEISSVEDTLSVQNLDIGTNAKNPPKAESKNDHTFVPKIDLNFKSKKIKSLSKALFLQKITKAVDVANPNKSVDKNIENCNGHSTTCNSLHANIVSELKKTLPIAEPGPVLELKQGSSESNKVLLSSVQVPLEPNEKSSQLKENLADPNVVLATNANEVENNNDSSLWDSHGVTHTRVHQTRVSLAQTNKIVNKISFNKNQKSIKKSLLPVHKNIQNIDVIKDDGNKCDTSSNEVNPQLQSDFNKKKIIEVNSLPICSNESSPADQSGPKLAESNGIQQPDYLAPNMQPYVVATRINTESINLETFSNKNINQDIVNDIDNINISVTSGSQKIGSSIQNSQERLKDIISLYSKTLTSFDTEAEFLQWPEKRNRSIAAKELFKKPDLTAKINEKRKTIMKHKVKYKSRTSKGALKKNAETNNITNKQLDGDANLHNRSAILTEHVDVNIDGNSSNFINNIASSNSISRSTDLNKIQSPAHANDNRINKSAELQIVTPDLAMSQQPIIEQVANEEENPITSNQDENCNSLNKGINSLNSNSKLTKSKRGKNTRSPNKSFQEANSTKNSINVQKSTSEQTKINKKTSRPRKQMESCIERSPVVGGRGQRQKVKTVPYWLPECRVQYTYTKDGFLEIARTNLEQQSVNKPKESKTKQKKNVGKPVNTKTKENSKKVPRDTKSKKKTAKDTTSSNNDKNTETQNIDRSKQPNDEEPVEIIKPSENYQDQSEVHFEKRKNDHKQDTMYSTRNSKRNIENNADIEQEGLASHFQEILAQDINTSENNHVTGTQNIDSSKQLNDEESIQIIKSSEIHQNQRKKHLKKKKNDYKPDRIYSTRSMTRNIENDIDVEQEEPISDFQEVLAQEIISSENNNVIGTQNIDVSKQLNDKKQNKVNIIKATEKQQNQSKIHFQKKKNDSKLDRMYSTRSTARNIENDVNVEQEGPTKVSTFQEVLAQKSDDDLHKTIKGTSTAGKKRNIYNIDFEPESETPQLFNQEEICATDFQEIPENGEDIIIRQSLDKTVFGLPQSTNRETGKLSDRINQTLNKQQNKAGSSRSKKIKLTTGNNETSSGFIENSSEIPIISPIIVNRDNINGETNKAHDVHCCQTQGYGLALLLSQGYVGMLINLIITIILTVSIISSII